MPPRWARRASGNSPASCSWQPRLMCASTSSAGVAGCSGARSITLSDPSAGLPSKASRYCPEPPCQRRVPSRTTTRSASADMLRPDSGIAAGRLRRRAFIARAMRLGGTFAVASACAVRRTIRSWKEKSHALRGPRTGETKPALTSVRIVLRGRCSSFCTSRRPNWCTLFLAGALPGWLGGLRRRCGRRPLGRFLLEARAQCFHEVDDLGAGLRRLGHGDFLAFDLLLHGGLDALAHLVLVGARVEFIDGLLLDQLLRELELRIAHFRLRDVDVLDRAHLGCVEELLHDEPIFHRTDHDDVLLAARRPAPERAALRLGKRARKQCVRLFSPRVFCAR